jgi:tetratricopeptide (TPR) repeat protein
MLSLCMIVRNEASRLARCVEPVRPLVDQIVVVDTGSTDATPDVARALGAELRRVPFEDFAQARRASLEPARGDWVLVLDADEEIDPAPLRALLERARRSEAAGFCFPRYDYVGRLGWGLSRPCRLFRRLPGVTWREPVFEEPLLPAAVGAGVQVAWEVALHHQGARRDEALLRERRALYETLLERARASTGPVFADAMRARLRADAGDLEEALGLLARCAAPGSREYWRHQARSHARLLLAAGRGGAALEVAEAALASGHLTPYRRSQMENVRGLILGALGRHDEACQALQRALRLGFPVAAYGFNLALALLRLGRAAAAAGALADAARLNPRLPGAIRDAGGAPDPRERWLHRLDTDADWEARRGALVDLAA